MIQSLDWRTDITICKRSILIDLLAQCTYDQIQIFNKMFGVHTGICEDTLDHALDLCEETIRKNNTRITG